MKKILVTAWIVAALASGAQSAFAQQSRCENPTQRDATCTGTSGVYGTSNTDNSPGTPRPSALSVTPRGSNSIVPPGVTVPIATAINQCVTVPFVTWAYDPASYGTPLPSFISTAGSGYIGSGGSNSPVGDCASDADGSCTTWVPQSHPFLFLGGNNFQDCSKGIASAGSYSCQATGGAAYMTTNPSAGWNFSAFMIACKDNSMPPASINGAPSSWWSSCKSSSSCNFSIIYPMNNERGN